MKIAFIHEKKHAGTGAYFVNGLMSEKLREAGVSVASVFPKSPLLRVPIPMRGLTQILFYHALIESRDEVMRCDLIQGTTFTPIAFLPLPIPVVSHFGSTTWGFLKAVPLTKDVEPALRPVWQSLLMARAVKRLSLHTRRPLRDIAEIERFVATQADAVIATSAIVRDELLGAGVDPRRLFVVPNAIEDFWRGPAPRTVADEPSLVFLGRLGSDAFTLRLKGLDRLIDFYEAFPRSKKQTVAMTANKALASWLREAIPNHELVANVEKSEIPKVLRPLAGSILLVPSRYEGFSLSLVEGMSQGLIPVTYPVGIAPEIIRQGENGYLIRTQAEGKRIIREILRLSTERRLEIAREAWKTSRQFSANTIARKLMRVHEKTIKSHVFVDANPPAV